MFDVEPARVFARHFRESRGIVGAEGIPHVSQRGDRCRNFVRGFHPHHGRTGGEPVAFLAAGGWCHDHQIGELRLVFITSRRRPEQCHALLIERRGTLLQSLGPRGHGCGVGLDFFTKLYGAFVVNAAFKPLIEIERIAEIEDGRMEWRALRGFDFLHEFALLLDLGDVLPELFVGAILLVHLRPTEHAEHFLIGDGEYRIAVGFLGVE